MNQNQTLSFIEATRLNRHERRRIGKINQVKIPGTSMPIFKDDWNNEKKKKFEESSKQALRDNKY